MKLLALIPALALVGCATPDFGKAVDANAGNYKIYNDGALAQQRAIEMCFIHNPDKAQCAILAASTNAVQTLAGRPDAIRVPKTSAEIAGEVVSDVAKFGIGAVVVREGVRTRQAPAPQVVNPEIVRPEIVMVPAN